jgi:hypothetical protein
VRPCLDEPNILTLLPKALTAEIEAIFADETGGVSADAAVKALWSAQISSSIPAHETAYSW